MTFDEFVAEWRRQVREYGGGVPQEAIDMAEQAWEIAKKQERETCIALCHAEEIAIQKEGDGCHDGRYLWMANGAERCVEELRSNVELSRR